MLSSTIIFYINVQSGFYVNLSIYDVINNGFYFFGDDELSVTYRGKLKMLVNSVNNRIVEPLNKRVSLTV